MILVNTFVNRIVLEIYFINAEYQHNIKTLHYLSFLRL